MLTFPITLYANSIVVPIWLTPSGTVVNAVEGDAPSVQLNVKKAISTDTLTFSIVGTNTLTAIGLSMNSSGLISGTVPTISGNTQTVTFTVHVVDQNGFSPPDRTFQANVTKLVVGVLLGNSMANWQTFAADPSVTGNLFDLGGKLKSLGAITKFNSLYYAGYGGIGVNLTSSTGDNYWRYAATVPVPAGTSNVVVGLASVSSATPPVMVLVGRNASTNYIMYSYDGLTWTQSPTSNAVAYKRLYSFGNFFIVITASSIEKSSDGITWTNITPATADVFTDVACDPNTGRMIAVTTNATAGVWKSTNPSSASDWAQVTVAGPTAATNSCVYSASTNLFYKCSTTGGKLAASSDMTNWTTAPYALIGTGQPTRMWTIDNNGMAFAYFNSFLSFAETDGVTTISAPATASVISAVTTRTNILDFYNDNTGVWFTANGTATNCIISHYAASASATMDFISYSTSVTSAVQTRVVWTNGVGWILLPWCMFSPDGIKWTYLNNSVLTTMINVALSQTSGLWIGVVPSTSGPSAYTSTDLINWTLAGTGTLASGTQTDYSLRPNGTGGFISGAFNTWVVSSTGVITNTGGNHGDTNNAKNYSTNANYIMTGATGALNVTATGLSGSYVNPIPGVNITSLTRSGTVATAVTAIPHGFATGGSAVIGGATPAGYNGTKTVTVVNSTTFTFTVTALTTPATGTITSTLAAAPGGSLLAITSDYNPSVPGSGTNVVACGSERISSINSGASWTTSATSISPAVSDIFYSPTFGKFYELGNTLTTTATTQAGTVQSLGLGSTFIKGGSR